MLRSTLRALATALVLTATAPSVRAQPAAAPPTSAQTASPELTRRTQDIVALLRGQADPMTLFTETFLGAVPPAQIAAIMRQLTTANGAVQGVERIDARAPTAATIRVLFERGILTMNLAIEPRAPHRISGLLVTGSEPRGADTSAALIRELQALPGQISFAIARVDDGAPAMVAGHQPDRALAIGSAFKLVVLAELSRQIQAGQRRWSDVVPLDRRSLPTGVMQAWPRGAPVTLHTLASLMISVSDNTATDMLLHVVGRDGVERMMATLGWSAAARNRPFLSTMELSALKLGPPELLAAWRGGDEAARRRLLTEGVDQVTPESLDLTRFTAGPIAIDTVEWFASAQDLVRTMDWLRQNGDQTARDILAINAGIGQEARARFGYLGYKGGSEPGVINLTFLVRNHAGAWHVATGSWNNPVAPVDELRFVALMTRALYLIR